MIIGNGMLAKAFSLYHDNPKVLIFASGVSNSLENKLENFKREIDLVEKAISENRDKLFVYFSTCSMYDPDAKNSLYVKHKMDVENLIKNSDSKYLILRVSQILGHSNNATLINFLFAAISKEEQFNVWKNSNRNLIAIEDVVSISKKLIEDKEHYNRTFHIANKDYIDVVELVNMIEVVLDKKAHYSLVDRGERYRNIPNDIEIVVDTLSIDFGVNYYEEKLQRYKSDA